MQHRLPQDSWVDAARRQDAGPGHHARRRGQPEHREQRCPELLELLWEGVRCEVGAWPTVACVAVVLDWVWLLIGCVAAVLDWSVRCEVGARPTVVCVVVHAELLLGGHALQHTPPAGAWSACVLMKARNCTLQVCAPQVCTCACSASACVACLAGGEVLGVRALPAGGLELGLCFCPCSTPPCILPSTPPCRTTSYGPSAGGTEFSALCSLCDEASGVVGVGVGVGA